MTTTPPTDRAFRRTVLIVAGLNLGYFGVEFAVATAIGSVSLLADSVDFLEDASMNLLIFFAVVWAARTRALVGRALALIILVPAVLTIATAIVKMLDPDAPDPVALSLTAVGALVVNLTAAVLLVRHRRREGSMARAAWLSARNDSFANIAVIVSAGLTALLASGWPDIIVGLGIGLLNAGAAREVWRAASGELAEPRA